MTFPLTLNNGQNFAAGELSPNFECLAERKVIEKLKNILLIKLIQVKNTGEKYVTKTDHEKFSL